MRVGNYSLMIPEGRERDSGHVSLEHGKQFTIVIGNHSYSRTCRAEVSLDGKPIGAFVLYRMDTAVLERAPHDNGRFTFYADASAEAAAAGIATVANTDRGLVQVKFSPEKRRLVLTSAKSLSRGAGGQGMGYAPQSAAFGGEEKTSGGITGLSGHSDQRFSHVPDFPVEEAEAVTISVRLIAAGTGGARPLTAAPAGNPVPAPVS